MSNPEPVPYTNDAEIEALVARFAACELPPDDVSHRVHVAMSAWCFLKSPEREAAGRIRDDLRRYVEWHHITIYNETITLFWARMIGKAVAGMDRARPAFMLVNEVVAQLGDSQLIFAYYTRERLQSEEARHGWVEPDLRPLDL
ncbi:MAG TPA: hypothetical protein VJ464_16380 [Blastocatellia bacterium]|nr:hypothetical protein [Blastocatellia bacterium]